MDTAPSNEPRRANLRVLELVRRSMDVLGEQYWLFVGMSALGLVLMNVVVLKGAVLCGLYAAFARRALGERVEFGAMFAGFARFLDSLLVTLIFIGLQLLVLFPLIAVLVVGLVLGSETFPPEEHAPVVVACISLLALVVGVVVSLAFAGSLFAYPLIADRGLAVFDAIGAGLKAVRLNAWGVARLVAVMGALLTVGYCCCWVGAAFVHPLLVGTVWLAYREVFPEPGAGPAQAGQAGAR